MAVTNATLAAIEDLRRQLTIMTDAQTLALTRAWVEAWDVLLPQFEDAVDDLIARAANGQITATSAARSVRLRGALDAARAYLEELAPGAADIITRDVPEVLRTAVQSHATIVETQLPPGSMGVSVSFARVPEEALAAIVARTTETIHSLTKPLPDDVVALMKSNLVRGIAVGANPRDTASRIVREAEGRFNGGLTRALVISRTETLDAYRAGTRASEKLNEDILTDWEWHAKLDARTCPSCIGQHGTRFPLETPGPFDHHQGRCARVSVTKSWKDLGFDIPEPPSETPDARSWFDNLTPETQKEIMGSERLRLLNEGKISWGDLSQKRTTPGWRDSYHPTSVRDLQKRAS